MSFIKVEVDLINHSRTVNISEENIEFSQKDYIKIDNNKLDIYYNIENDKRVFCVDNKKFLCVSKILNAIREYEIDKVQ